MWLFLWVLIVLSVIGFFLWSYHELYEQKRLWKKFAMRHNLTYIAGRFAESPAMTGDLKGRKVNFYPMPIENASGGATTYNVMEVFLNQIPDIACIVANVGFSDFVAAVDLPEPFEVNHDDWPKAILARKFIEDDAAAWFMQEPNHIAAIQNLAKLPFHIAFVADGDQAFVAVRTANPLNDEKKFNMLIKKLYGIAGMLESNPQALTQSQTKTPENQEGTSEISSGDASMTNQDVDQKGDSDDPYLPPGDMMANPNEKSDNVDPESDASDPNTRLL